MSPSHMCCTVCCPTAYCLRPARTTAEMCSSRVVAGVSSTRRVSVESEASGPGRPSDDWSGAGLQFYLEVSDGQNDKNNHIVKYISQDPYIEQLWWLNYIQAHSE